MEIPDLAASLELLETFDKSFILSIINIYYVMTENKLIKESIPKIVTYDDLVFHINVL